MPFYFLISVSVAKIYRLGFTKAGNTSPGIPYILFNNIFLTYIKRNAYFICLKFEIFAGK